MKDIKKLLFITSVLAFCSMVYELILAQTLSAFLENTVLRYSVTIGLYMFSMGIGSLLAEGKVTQRPVLNLLRVEVLLTVFGGLSVVLLFGLSFLTSSRLLLSLAAHGLILTIGVLTGFEIPLLVELVNRQKSESENLVLGWDYVGAFIGTLAFAFGFYPYAGLVTASFFVATLNAFCGLWLCGKTFQKEAETHSPVFILNCRIQIFLALLIGICLCFSAPISEYLIAYYVK